MKKQDYLTENEEFPCHSMGKKKINVSAGNAVVIKTGAVPLQYTR